MKFSTSQMLLAAAAPLANAFPMAMMEEAAKNPEIAAQAVELSKMMAKRQGKADAATAIFEPSPQFNAEEQLINVGPGSGHEYQAPRPGDLRGPCPGLNAFANHGFLPRNGYATIQQYIDATTEVVGMGPLLAGFLSVLGAAIDGDLTAWSMAGTPPLGVGGPLAQQGNGLVGSHNKYEGDASPTRPDLYQSGNNYECVTEQFEELIQYSPGGEVTLDSLTNFRSHRFDTQVATNGYFFNGPFSGVAVQPAAYTFIYRFMANHSEENPIGLLSYDTIASWFGVEGQPGSYRAVQGTERIPDNWYKRANAYPYEVTYFIADLINAAALHPKFLNIGGNTGEPNTFTGVDVDDLTGGLFNGASLLEGNNLGCFVYQFAAQAKPDALLGVLTPLLNVVSQVVTTLGCPQLQKIDDEQLKAFPGYTRNVAYS